MKIILFIGAVGIALGAAMGVRPAAVWNAYHEIFPSDPARRWALDQCFAQDPHFDRLDPAARAACYAHDALNSAAARDPARRAAATSGNFVDLWRAAGQGSMPQNDIRAAEQIARYPGQVAAAARNR